MGGSESSSLQSPLYPNHGYRIMNIKENSPITKTDIRRMVDFICYEPESETDTSFTEIISEKKEKGESMDI